MTQNFLYIYEKNCHHQFFLLKIEFNVALQFLFNVVILRVATWSGKTKKNDKSQVKTGVFEKSQEKSRKNYKKHQILSVQILIFRILRLVKN